MNIVLLMHKVGKGCLDLFSASVPGKTFLHPGHDYTNHTE